MGRTIDYFLEEGTKLHNVVPELEIYRDEADKVFRNKKTRPWLARLRAAVRKRKRANGKEKVTEDAAPEAFDADDGEFYNGEQRPLF